MTYLVLARKHRPNRFSEMIGQEHITRTLANAIANDRVHHAYLFCGVRGLGKTSAARILARALVCENGPTPNPCNECEHCLGVLEGRSVDVREIDGASNNSVDDIRNLRDQVQYLPQSARRKIYIIDEVHMLSNSAFNALLKTLEEPPPHVTFIFATTDPQKVLGTILSRVSRLDFRRVSASEIAAHLNRILEKENVSANEDALYQIASCADGSVRDALTLLDKVLAFSSDTNHISTEEVQTILGLPDRQAAIVLVESMLGQNPTDALHVLQLVTASSSNLQQFAISVLRLLRDIAVVLATGDTQSLSDASESHCKYLQRQAASCSLAQVGQVFDRFARVVDDMDRSRIPRLVLEMVVLEITNTPSAVSISDMIDRLEALTKGQLPRPSSSSAPPSSQSTPSTPSGGTPSQISPKGKVESSGEATRNNSASHPEIDSAPAPTKNLIQAQYIATQNSEPARNSEFEAHLWRMVKKSDIQSEPEQTRPRSTSPAPESGTSEKEPTFDSEQTVGEKRFLSSNSHNSDSHDSDLHNTVLKERDSRESPSQTLASESKPLSSVTPADRAISSDPPSKPDPSKPDHQNNTPRCAPSNWQDLPAFDQWEAFLASIRGKDDLLFAVLAQAGLIKLSSERIELALAKSGIAASQIDAGTELRNRFRTHLLTYFGNQPILEFVDRPPSVVEKIPSLHQIEAVRERKCQEEREREAREHPQIRALLSSFSARLGPVIPVSPP